MTGVRFVSNNLIEYQPTTGTLFGLPCDVTSVSAPLVLESTDPEQTEVAVLTGDWLVVYPAPAGPGSLVPPPYAEGAGSGDEPPATPDRIAPALNEDEDPLLAALWDNPEDDRYDAP